MRWRPPRTEERQLLVIWGAGSAAALLGRSLWLRMAEGLPRCAFKALTGIPCPTCGTTRAAVAMLEGHIVGALAANPLAAIVGGALVAGGLLGPFWALVRGPVPELDAPLPRPVRLAVIAVVLVNWAFLIVAGR